MKNLIEALTIFAKYKDVPYPTHCEHDVLYIMDVTYDEVTEEDRKRLETLQFIWSTSDSCWLSYHFGRA